MAFPQSAQVTENLNKNIIRQGSIFMPLRYWQVLLVEENGSMQIAVQNQLTALNCEVEAVDSDGQALERTAKTVYDLIIIGLPDFEGCKIARQIRQNRHNLNQHTAIVALSKYVSAENQHACLAAGMQRVLIKPLQENQAREVIARYAGRQS